MSEYKVSNAYVLKSVPKSDDAPYGVIPADTIDVNRPTIIALSGELTDNPRFANHYIKQLKQVLANGGVDNATIYSVYYDFGSRDTTSERAKLFQRACHRIRNMSQDINTINAKIKMMDENEPSPKYIEQLYNILLAPILATDGTDTRPDINTVAQRASYIRFYAHSHGAAVATMLGKIMAKEMSKMGYKISEIRAVQQNIIVIQHGPITPLERPNFTTLSFASASDTKVNLHNRLHEYAYDNSFDLYPSYFGRAGAHIFTAGSLSNILTKEHDNDGLVNDDILSEDGQIIFSAQRNAIVNSMRMAGQPTPDISNLVSGPGVDFKELQSNGKWFYQLMMKDIKSQTQQNPAHDYQI